jgi:hypothetical protein
VDDVESELPSCGRTLLPKANDKEL